MASSRTVYDLKINSIDIYTCSFFSIHLLYFFFNRLFLHWASASLSGTQTPSIRTYSSYRLMLSSGHVVMSKPTVLCYYRYGFSNMRYIASLISGVGIFMMGAGLSWYHGIMGLLHPQPIESLLWVSSIGLELVDVQNYMKSVMWHNLFWSLVFVRFLRLHLFNWRHSKNLNIVKFYTTVSFWMYFNM